MRPEDYGILVILGGWAPQRPEGRRFCQKGCGAHGDHMSRPQLLISAKLLEGRRLTCVSAIRDDVINAEAAFLGQPFVLDGNLVTSRVPRDLSEFAKEIIETTKENSFKMSGRALEERWELGRLVTFVPNKHLPVYNWFFL